MSLPPVSSNPELTQLQRSNSEESFYDVLEDQSSSSRSSDVDSCCSSDDDDYLTPDESINDDDFVYGDDENDDTFSSIAGSNQLDQDHDQDQVLYMLPIQRELQRRPRRASIGSGSISELVPNRMKRVSWIGHDVVSEVRFRPFTTLEEKGNLFYNDEDMRIFKNEYRSIIKAKKQLQNKLDQTPSVPSFTTPMTGLVNMFTTYLSSSGSLSPSSSSRSSSPQRSRFGLDTSLLVVDTMYIF